MSKRLIALPVAMLAIAAFAPGIATAANFNTTATIAIKGSQGKTFGGRVNSSRAACKSNRTVTLQRKSPGAANFVAIGSDKSANNGDWQVNTNPISGAQYRAQVAVKNLGGGNKCVAATSPVVTARQSTSTIAIGTPAGLSFRGDVNSTSSGCESGRLVTLQRKLPGGSFANVANDTTGAGGAWEVPTNPVNGAQYKGFVSAKQVGSNSCMAVNSPVTTARVTNLTIQQGGSTNFHGVANSVPACEPNRTVTLQRSVTAPYTAFTNVGTDATDGSGAWRVNTSVISGAHYRAFVGARQAGANSCMSDMSNEVTAT